MNPRRHRIPAGVTWQQRPFPDANLLLLQGTEPAMVDSGFVGHAQQTADWAYAQIGRTVTTIVNTHWHSDHVGGNALLQSGGAAIAASSPDAEAVTRRDPGCCVAEYLDQPVAPYAVDIALDDKQTLSLGNHDWQVISTPGHTPGHLCLWQPEHRLLAVGDALSSYDVGWVNLALDGPDAATTALESLQRLIDLNPRVLLPAHGAVPEDTGAALAAAARRTQRLVDDPAGAVWYAARRIFAFALMIRGGIPSNQVETYLQERAWLNDAARLLDTTPEDLATELIGRMTTAGAVIVRDGRLCAAAEHASVPPDTLRIPMPKAWPPVTTL
jgi:glyoxylase-like metal-dependent hydrolase (beta-lactamase superfamily II)